MLNREACERRVYRLATLLIGDPVTATRVIEAVVDAQPDLRRLDSAHLDRLTVLRSREIGRATIVDAAVPPAVASALASLPSQQREAWVFIHVYRVPQRETARAMDCSVTATTRHLQMAEAAMAAPAGDLPRMAAEALLNYSMSLEVPTFWRAQRRRRQTMRRLRLAIVVGLVLAAMILALMWLKGVLVAA
ncbi:MAG: hypothetical protein IH889_09975 [Planctomycetes bacterium]|nr:hypothetical protein [Planctomycetota bacterium]